MSVAGIVAAATEIVDFLITEGIDIAAQRQEAIDALVRKMDETPPDPTISYEENREKMLGDDRPTRPGSDKL